MSLRRSFTITDFHRIVGNPDGRRRRGIAHDDELRCGVARALGRLAHANALSGDEWAGLSSWATGKLAPLVCVDVFQDVLNLQLSHFLWFLGRRTATQNCLIRPQTEVVSQVSWRASATPNP